MNSKIYNIGKQAAYIRLCLYIARGNIEILVGLLKILKEKGLINY